MSRTGSTTRDRTANRRRPSGSRTRVAAAPDRQSSRRTSRSRRSLRIAAALTVAAAVGWLLWLGPVLAVRTVQVDGTVTLSADQVRAAAQVPRGDPLLRIDLGPIEDRVARLPQVRDVQVSRSWPDRIVVTVAERVPVAVVGDRGRRVLLDAEGIPFDTVSGEAPRGVVPLDVADPRPGDPATTAGLAAIRALPTVLRNEVEQVSAPDPENVSVSMTDGTVVRWGSAERSETKGTVLVALLERVDAGELERASVVDVSTPDAVVLR